VSTNALAKTVASKYPSEHPTWNIPEIIPRAAGGQSSIAVAAVFPYRPPIAMPKSARQARKELYLLVKPVANSRTIKKDIIDDKWPLATVSVGCNPKNRRPNRPQHEDKRDAPSDFRIVLSNCFAS
jgi:hypothetical protein